ncbi:MAG TPA: hypothetical protein VND87_11110 [Stellaceae bacterium]|nr:hypothetical protein [Stellaceae bacterium]
MKSHMPRWPTGSPDPLVNILATGALVVMAIFALATSFLLLVPIAIGFGVIGALRWYHYRPPPYSNPAIAASVEQHTIAANFPDTETFADSYAQRLVDAWHPRVPVLPVLLGIVNVAADFYEMEAFNNPVAPLPTDPIEQGRWRDELRIHSLKMHDAPRTLGIFTEALTRSLAAFRNALPDAVLATKDELAQAGNHPPALSVTARDLMPDPDQLIPDLAAPLSGQEITDLRLFRDVRVPLAQSDIRATPFHQLFEIDVPFALPDEARFAGHWIVSPPGRGKTTLLHAMVMQDIQRPGASLILMDSKGDLIDPIRGLSEIQDRLVIIDPDPQNPVAINPLDIGQTDLAQSVDLLEYLFASLLEFKMTAMQTTLFRSVLRALVVAFPNPTLETFRDLLTNGYDKYKDHIANLPPDLQDFFYRDFNEKNYVDRRREVLQRLRLLLDNETMRAMLTAASTRFRISEVMDTGKIVIINNSKARLGDQGAEFFGRFFIAQVLAAAQQRSTRRRTEKPPVFFYIDECQNVIARDEKIPTILDECRSQNIALIMAHQRTKQISSDNVLDALSNCAIRFANSDEEARYLAPRLRTSPDFLQYLGRGKFAAFVRDVTPEAVAVSVHRVEFGEHGALSPAERNALAERMRAQYGTPRQTAADSPPAASAGDQRGDPTGDAPASEPAAEPILNLHHPDLPWRLEDGPKPNSETDDPQPPPPPKPRPQRRGSPKKDDSKTEGASDWR